VNRLRNINRRRLAINVAAVAVLSIAIEATFRLVGWYVDYKGESVNASGRTGFTFGVLFALVVAPQLSRAASALYRRFDRKPSQTTT
jgi:hypothetical protein